MAVGVLTFLAVASALMALIEWPGRRDAVVAAIKGEVVKSMGVREVLAEVGRWVSRGNRGQDRRALLDRVGVGLDEAGWAGLKLVCGAAAAVVVGCVAALAHNAPAAVLLVGAVGALAYRAPDVWLARANAGLMKAAERELPVFLDLMAVVMRSETSIYSALMGVRGHVRGSLGKALNRMTAVIATGGTVDEALSRMEADLPLSPILRFCLTLRRALETGEPMAAILQRVARDERERWLTRAKERARQAPMWPFSPASHLKQRLSIPTSPPFPIPRYARPLEQLQYLSYRRAQDKQHRRREHEHHLREAIHGDRLCPFQEPGASGGRICTRHRMSDTIID